MNTNISKSYYPRHDDMLGILGTGISGANQWNVKNINDTLYPCGFLRNNSNDFATVRIQSPHWRQQGIALDSIHIHYVLDLAATLNQTIIFDTYWTWAIPGQSIPALTNWNSVLNNQLILPVTNTWHYGIHSIVPAPSAPVTEGYGLYLLVRTVRGNGTYTGEFGVLDIDAHATKDRTGSINEVND